MKSRNIEAIYPLSPVQEGILFHTRYAPQSGMYVIQFSCLLEGWLDVRAFKQAWQQVVEQHPALRTLFAWERREKPLQIVRREVDLSWQEEDWQAIAPEEQEKRWQQLLQQDQKQGFDLLKAPLMRFYLLRVARKRYQFVWSVHHLILDGWSASLILKQLFNFYHMLEQGRHLLLQPSRPYKDYITSLKKHDLSKIEAFWQTRLQDFSAPTPIGIERTAWSEPVEIEYDEEIHHLSIRTTAALQQIARKHRLTRNTLIQAAWALLLSRYSGERDVLFGTTVSGRSGELANIESMVGLFINTLPVRATIMPEMDLLSWLQSFDAQQQGLHEYEHSPLVTVQGCSQVPRDQPLFESILVFGNYPSGQSLQKQNSKLKISAVRFRERTSYPLTVFIDDGLALTLRIGYEAQRFEQAAIRRMLGHLQTLLESMIENLEQRVSDLTLLTEAERHHLLVEMNDNGFDYPRHACLHQLFEAQVEATPDATALIVNQERLSYRQLNEKANQLAHGLQQLGVGPEQLVGVCMARDSLLPVTLLAILKAGGAYVPLDPAYPPERLAFIREDAQLSLLLTQERILKGQASLNLDDGSQSKTKIVCVDRDWGQIAQNNSSNPTSHVTSDHLAYVIYTSGSTGKPKGVAIEHHSPVALLAWAERYFARDLFNGMLFSTSICFDLSVFELFMPLSCGGTVILAENALQLPTLPAAQEVTVINTVPSAIAELVRLDGIPSSVQATILAGEPLKAELVQKIVQKGQIKQVFDLYGPSEDTTYSTYALRQADKPATIGRAIGNTQLYLLDEHLNPVPFGAIGEIYLGGAGLARGYLNRPALTAQRFIIINKPFQLQTDANARLYKTGDLARYTPQGQLEFLGRRDYQVKVRGFRIELGEIEATLTQHASIREAVVMAHQVDSEEKRLVAYIVPKHNAASNGSQPVNVSEWRQFLSQKLPSYMMPAAFVPLDRLPLTPNGKINRKALPAPDWSQQQSHTFVAPRSANEAALAQMWSDLLGIKQIGIHDNFFELGGHSLLATKLIARLRKQFDVNLPLSALFEAPTIASLATTIVQKKAADVDEAMLQALLEELD